MTPVLQVLHFWSCALMAARPCSKPAKRLRDDPMHAGLCDNGGCARPAPGRGQHAGPSDSADCTRPEPEGVQMRQPNSKTRQQRFIWLGLRNNCNRGVDSEPIDGFVRFLRPYCAMRR
jgi:hypothetical protein